MRPACLLLFAAYTLFALGARPGFAEDSRVANRSVVERAKSVSVERVKRVEFRFLEPFVVRSVNSKSDFQKIRDAFLKSSRLKKFGTEPEEAAEMGTFVVFVMKDGKSVSFRMVEDDLDDHWGEPVAKILRSYRKRLLPKR